jgi:hypothetical protein
MENTFARGSFVDSMVSSSGRKVSDIADVVDETMEEIQVQDFDEIQEDSEANSVRL